MKLYQRLLLENKAWAREKKDTDPEYFNKLARNQHPELLWIGCSDSRIPANEVTGTQPGELFVHRNIANLVVPDDLNLLSVLEYAVVHLKVKHIIVCGHYGCGGINAALSAESFGLLDHWLGHIKKVIRSNEEELAGITDPEKKSDRLVELSIRQQVLNLARTEVVQKAWRNDQPLHLHGWAYGLKNGLLKRIYDIDSSFLVTFTP